MKTLRALALSLLVCAGAFAQNAGLLPVPKMQFLDGNGYPLAGGLVYTCVAGSSCPGTPLASYTDSTGSVQNTNPVQLDAGGFASIWIGSGLYKIVVETSAGVVVSSTDNISSTAARAGAPNGLALLDSTSHVVQGELGYAAADGSTRQVSTKLATTRDVMADFGAAGDGASDDRLKIQAALDWAGTVCGTVIFPAGHTFLIASNPTNTTLLTYSPCTSMDGGGTIKLASGLGIFQSVFKCAQALQPATIRNLTFDMNGDGNPITSDPGTTNYQMTFWFIATPSGSGLRMEDCTFLNGHGVWTLNTYADNVTVTRCNWYNWGVSSIFFDTSLLYIAGNGSVVTNNTFVGTGTAAHTAIEVHASNKVVSNNVIKGFFAGIIYSSDANGGTSSNITISNNAMDNVWFGIQWWANDGGINGITMNGNAININRNYNFSAWGGSAGGGEVGIGTYVLSHYPISNVNITGNSINWTHETGSYPTVSFQTGIGLFTASTAPGGTVTNAVIADNTITGTASAGIGISAGATITGLEVKGNSILNPGQSTLPNLNFRDGIMLTATPSWVNSTISDNLISDTQATPTMQRGILWGGVAGDNAGSQVIMRRNQVRYTGTPIQYFNIQTSAPLFDVDVPGYAANSALLSLTSLTAGNQPPTYAAIIDSQSGRVWRNMTSSAIPPFWSSQEVRDTVPTTGDYNQGDIVWAGDSAIGGFAAWVNVLKGSPGTFAKMQLSNAGTNSPFTSTVAGPSFTANGSAGLTTSAVAGASCTLTITGGIITGKTGC